MITKEEKRMVEITDTVYIAVDGTRFKTESACLAYEKEYNKIQERAESIEINELYDTYPLDTDGQYINEHHEYNWYKVSNEDDYNCLVEMYGDDVVRPKSYPDVICIENDIYYKSDIWSYLLSDMMESTIVFWNKQGYDVKIDKRLDY